MLSDLGEPPGDLRTVDRPHAVPIRLGARAACIMMTWVGACRPCGSTVGMTCRSVRTWSCSITPGRRRRIVRRPRTNMWWSGRTTTAPSPAWDPTFKLGRPGTGRRQLRERRPGPCLVRPLAEGRAPRLPGKHAARSVFQHGRERLAHRRPMAAGRRARRCGCICARAERPTAWTATVCLSLDAPPAGEAGRPLSLRPHEPGPDHRRRRLLQRRPGDRRRLRPASDRGSQRRTGLYVRRR